tara:strand:+ start:287 stop:646 length:360 start_codon:yes stop_codon:yes gene_type:complete
MKKKSFIYSDLSNKELDNLKDYYIQKKIESMNNKELKEFVSEIISLQIKNTIGKEEEIEAWREMSDFFGEEFEIIILEMQAKFEDDSKMNEIETETSKLRQELIERNKLGTDKKDMWDD